MSCLLDPQKFVGDKLKWHQRLSSDPTISLSAKAVAGFILHDLDADAGGAWRGQESMATKLGVSDRQLRRLLDELATADYLQIEVRRGRKRTNIYRATFPADQTEAAFERTSTADQTEENRTQVTVQMPKNRTYTTQKPDMGVRQSLYDSIRKPPARQRGPEVPPAVAVQFPCPDVRQTVVSLAGEAATISYLDQATWDPAAQQILCRSDTATTRLRALAGERLAGRGITIARQSASAVPSRMAA